MTPIPSCGTACKTMPHSLVHDVYARVVVVVVVVIKPLLDILF